MNVSMSLCISLLVGADVLLMVIFTASWFLIDYAYLVSEGDYIRIAILCSRIVGVSLTPCKLSLDGRFSSFYIITSWFGIGASPTLFDGLVNLDYNSFLSVMPLSCSVRASGWSIICIAILNFEILGFSNL